MQQILKRSVAQKLSFFLVPPCELTKNGGCAQRCTDNGDVAVCTCKEPDFKLAKDGKGCDKGKLPSLHANIEVVAKNNPATNYFYKTLIKIQVVQIVYVQ